MAIQSSINQAIHSISQLSALGKIGKESEKTAKQSELSTNLALASASDYALKRVQEIQSSKMSQIDRIQAIRQMHAAANQMTSQLYRSGVPTEELPKRQPLRQGDVQ